MNSWFVFFNASIQGNANIVRRLVKSKAVRRAVYTIMAAGVVQHLFNMWAAGDDDDGENRYAKMLANEPWTFERNMVFFIPGSDGKFIKIPMPYGYNAFYNVGLNAGMVGTGMKSPGMGLLDSARVALDAFNPLGGGSWMSMVLPTILDPAWDIATNTNFFGSPIHPSPNPFDPAPDPASLQSWGSTHWLAKEIAETLNEWSGGDDVQPGKIDVYPDTLEYLWGYLTGGVGRFFADVSQTAENITEGEIEPKRLPWVKSLYGKVNEDNHRNDYFRLREQVLQVEGYLKGYGQEGNDEIIEQYERDHPVETAAIPAFKSAEKARRAIKKQRRAIKDDADITSAERADALKGLDDAEAEVIAEARKAYARAARASVSWTPLLHAIALPGST